MIAQFTADLSHASILARGKLIVLKNSIEVLNKELSIRKNKGGYSVSKDYMNNLVEIDLSFVKSSIVNAGDLIFELNEAGKVTPNSYTSGLLTSDVPKIEEFNASVKGFNDAPIGSELRKQFSYRIDEFGRSLEQLNQSLDKFKVVIEKMLEE